MEFWLTSICRSFWGMVAFCKVRESIVILIALPIISAITIIFHFGWNEYKSKFKWWIWGTVIPNLIFGGGVFIWYLIKMPNTIVEETKRVYDFKIEKLGEYNASLIEKNATLETILASKSKNNFDSNAIAFSINGRVIYANGKSIIYFRKRLFPRWDSKNYLEIKNLNHPTNADLCLFASGISFYEQFKSTYTASIWIPKNDKLESVFQIDVSSCMRKDETNAYISVTPRDPDRPEIKRLFTAVCLEE